MDEVYLTKKGHQKLLEELEGLKTTKRRKLTKAIAEARAHGDISENAEYDAAKEAQGLNEKRIADLESKLSRVRIIEDQDIPSGIVLIGATVKLTDMETREQLEYMLVSEAEADYNVNKISINSPVGSALLEHKEGDEVEIKVPAGTLRYKILNITR